MTKKLYHPQHSAVEKALALVDSINGPGDMKLDLRRKLEAAKAYAESSFDGSSRGLQEALDRAQRIVAYWSDDCGVAEDVKIILDGAATETARLLGAKIQLEVSGRTRRLVANKSDLLLKAGGPSEMAFGLLADIIGTPDNVKMNLSPAQADFLLAGIDALLNSSTTDDALRAEGERIREALTRDDGTD